jgi:hypothetical protein
MSRIAQSALVAVLIGVSHLPAVAQEEGTPLRGRVVADETGRPIPDIQLRFRDGTRVNTDLNGRFEVFGLAAGEHRVALVSPSCVVNYGTLLVVPGTTWETHLSFPESLADLIPELTEQGIGSVVVTASEIQGMNVSTLVDVVRRVAPTMLAPGSTQPGQTVQVRGRNRATLSGETQPIFLLDGVWIGETPEVLMDVAPTDVAAMEIILGSQGAWKYGTSGGAVRIWTWQGIQPTAAGDPDECVVDFDPAGARREG